MLNNERTRQELLDAVEKYLADLKEVTRLCDCEVTFDKASNAIWVQVPYVWQKVGYTVIIEHDHAHA